MRNRLSTVVSSAKTLYKQGYDMPLTCTLDANSQNEIVLRLGPHTFSLTFDSSRTRDLAVLCVRMFAGPDCPLHETESDLEEV